jgi:hypothetical protein
MYAGWMIVNLLLGAIATLIVWTLFTAMLVAWIRDRHRHRHAR